MQYDELSQKYQAATKELLDTLGEAVGQVLQDKINIKADDPTELSASVEIKHEFPILKLTTGSKTDASYEHIFLMDKSLAGLIFSWMAGGDPPEEVGSEELNAVKEVVAQVLGQLQAALEGEEFSFTAGEVELEEVASQDDLSLPEAGLLATYKFTRGKKKTGYTVTHALTGDLPAQDDGEATSEVAADEEPSEVAEDAPADSVAADEETSEGAEDAPADPVVTDEEPSEGTEDVSKDLAADDDASDAIADDKTADLALETDDLSGGATDMDALFGDSGADTAGGGIVEISQADFGDLGESAAPANGRGREIDMLLDVKLDVTVELGRKDMLVEEILRLGKGSVIELDKLAGEPVDVLVNGKKLAEGEVVVVEDHFGVRLTHLLETRERIKSLGT